MIAGHSRVYIEIMLPPREVPVGLSPQEYQKLAIRYQMLRWPKQMAACSRRLVASGDVAMSDKNRVQVTALMTAMEVTFTVSDTVNEIRGTVDDAIKLAAEGVGKVLDRSSYLARARKTVGNALGVASGMANDAVHKVFENVVMPRLGLPIDYLPEGLSAADYLKMGARYEQFGYAEQARSALKETIKLAPQSNEAKRARLRLSTRIPGQEVTSDAGRRYVDALKSFVTQELDECKQTLELLIRDYPEFEWPYLQLGRLLMMEGEIERAKDLAGKVLKLNPYMLKAHLLLATIDLIEWNITSLDQRIKRMSDLDSDSPELATFTELLALIDQQGLR